MTPEIEYGEWWEVDTSNGMCAIPEEYIPEHPQLKDFLDYIEVRDVENIFEYQKISGWGVRLSASGYLDCTEWCVFNTQKEAIAYVEEIWDITWDEKTNEWKEL